MRIRSPGPSEAEQQIDFLNRHRNRTLLVSLINVLFELSAASIRFLLGYTSCRLNAAIINSARFNCFITKAGSG